MPGWMLSVAGLFSPFMREVSEMQYQFTEPFIMSDSRIRRLLGLEPTPFDEQVSATAAWIRTRT